MKSSGDLLERDIILKVFKKNYNFPVMTSKNKKC